MPQLSIIIVSYNVSSHLIQCLRAVERSLAGIDGEVIVVDNASGDDTCHRVEADFPWVNLVSNADNLGFSKACNQGLQLAHGEFVLFLNPDAVVGEGAFERCLDFMRKHPDAGGVGVRMVDGQGKYLPESKRGFPTFSASFGKMLGLYRFFPRSRFFSAYYMGHLSENEIHEVEVLTGAFLMMPAKLAKQLGGFDERFFMYAEDIDLSYRIQQAGYKNFYFPEVTITHYKGKSTALHEATYTRRFYGAMELYIQKYYAQHSIKRMLLLMLVRSAKGLAHVKRMIFLSTR